MRFSALALGAVLLIGVPGLAGAQTPMTEAQIRQKLEAEGYSNIKVTEHAKSHIDVTASKNGKTEKLAVDPRTGTAKPDEDED
jgi:peptidase YpeB-like protein